MALDLAGYRNAVLLGASDYRGELRRRGWPEGDRLVSVALTCPELLRDLLDGWLDAGAGILLTNTAEANTLAIEQHAATHAAADWREINRRAAALALEAAGKAPWNVLVVGSVGGCARLLRLAEVTETEIASACGRQGEVLAEAGVQALLCRGFAELEALKIAVSALVAATPLPVIGSLVFEMGADHVETLLGVTPPQATAELAEAGAAAIGCEAGDAPDGLSAVVSLMRQSSDLPIWVETSAGGPLLLDGRLGYPEPPDAFAVRVRGLVEAGGNLIVGGAGVTAEHLATAISLVGRARV